MSEAYDELVARADGAMIVVTACDGTELAGCVVGFHSQCGIDPPRHAVWLSKANHTYRVALHSSHLAVHFLTVGDEAVASVFGELTGDSADKFEMVEWSRGQEGTPLVTALPNRFVGRRLTVLDVGHDHVCFVVGADEATCADEFEPLRLSALGELSPGHPAEERPVPADASRSQTQG
ncbi:flavin reductase [Ammonicoccus fulvus]|uniref:Flavin reductase n=1 Tax=Ammonicoccus fulvus TaxID=3138240 RepID=A0ABZ3FJ12_9ACTN